MSICSRCKVPHGRAHSYCKECHLAYNREWRQRNPEKVSAWARPGMGSRGEIADWRKANPDKSRAHKVVERELRSGRLVRPEGCSLCGAQRPQAHHPDYTQPLNIIWLCQRCHARLHQAEVAA